MTILEAQNLLYQYFETHDFFSKDSLKKILSISEDPQEEEAAIFAALDNFEKSELLKKVEHKNVIYYILIKPFAAYNQTISISSNLAKDIALLVNKYCDKIGNSAEKVDAHSITEMDIKKLLIICLNLGKPSVEEE